MAGPGPSQAPTTSVVVIVEYDQSSRPTATRTVTEVIQDGTTSTLSAPNTSTGTSSSSQNTSSVLSISSGNTTAQPVSTLTTTATRPLNCPGTYLSIASLCEYDTSGTPIGLRESTTTFLSGSGTTSLPVVLVTYVPIQAVSNSSATSPSTADSTASSQTGMSSPSHTTAPSHKNSTGAIAGAAVGGIVAGALIAGLIGFFLLKKRARKDRYVSRNTYVPAASPAYGGEKGTPMVSIASAATMDFLPQQADDAEVSRKISTVVDQIDQHVENFYANRGAPMDANREAEISRFETSELPLPLAACFQNSGAPMTLIKHCLAYHIFNLTMSPSEHAMPLLPAEIAGVVTSMYHKSLSPVASKDTITAFSTWKSLTRYLRPDLGRDASTARTLSESSSHFATHFTNVFSPWAHAQYSNDIRARHLTELINQAVQTAIWLFGQPDNYKFEWDLPKTRQNANYSAVIIPAVWKTTHGGTRLENKGQNVLSPAIKGF